MAAPLCRSSRRVLSLPQRPTSSGQTTPCCWWGSTGYPVVDQSRNLDRSVQKGKGFGEIDSFEEKKKTERIKIETSPSQEYQKTIFRFSVPLP